MKMKTRNVLRRAAALFLAAALSVPSAWAAAGTRKLHTVSTLTDGLTFQNTISTNNTNRVESFSFEMARDSAAEAILIQGVGAIYGGATINSAATQAQNMGYRVLGAINTDFFAPSTGVPMGISIEDGTYKSCSVGEAAMVIGQDGSITLNESPQVQISLTNRRTGVTTSPHCYNKTRADTGGVYLLTRDFSAANSHSATPGWYVRMKVVDSQAKSWNSPHQKSPLPLTVNSTITLEVTELLRSNQSIVIGENEYVLTAADQCGYGGVFDGFQMGDQVTLTTTCADQALSSARWAGGVGDVLVRGGAVTSSAGWNYASGRAPRTALGVKADGTLVLYAVDGRQSGYSVGLTEQDLAEEMRDRGCQWAVNLDGGGSTAISVQMPGQATPTVRNIPSDGAPRACATYLLLVCKDASAGAASRLALAEDGLTVLAGSSVQLPNTLAMDKAMHVVQSPVSDVTITSQDNLGYIENGVYHAGTAAGTDDLYLYSWNLDAWGAGQVHVVDALSTLTVSRSGSTSALTALTVKPGDTVQLGVSGTYWSRTALRDFGPVTWTASGNPGTVSATGLYTAPDGGTGGTLTATAGGLSQSIQITLAGSFRDVPVSHWAYPAIQYCYEHGIASGVSEGMFGLNSQISRGDFVLMLYGAAGKPAPTGSASFQDVAPSDYYYKAISWGAGAGVVSGTGEGKFSPQAPVTREQAFTILHQAMPLMGKGRVVGSITILDQFADKNRIDAYAVGHAAALVEHGLVSGKGNNLDPKGSLTRAEMATLLYGVIRYTPEGQNPGTQDPGTQDPETQQPGDTEYTLTLDKSDVTLSSGESFTLSASLTPAFEGAQITWSSSNPAAAAVSPDGVVTNLFPGTGTSAVTITANWSGLSAQCIVRCKQAGRTGTVIDAEVGLNVRSGPGTQNPKVGSLQNGAQVVILGEENGWYHILYLSQDNQAAIGYVSGAYLLPST